jgi:hypothetical protein
MSRVWPLLRQVTLMRNRVAESVVIVKVKERPQESPRPPSDSPVARLISRCKPFCARPGVDTFCRLEQLTTVVRPGRAGHTPQGANLPTSMMAAW